MTSDPKAAAGGDDDRPAGGTDATQGVPIVPGVPLLADLGNEGTAGATAAGGRTPVDGGSEDTAGRDETPAPGAGLQPAGPGDIPGGPTALTGDAAEAPNGAHLNAYAIPVSVLPPSDLQGPTLSVPAPTADTTAASAATAPAVQHGQGAEDLGWQPSRTRTDTGRGSTASRDAVPERAATDSQSRRERVLGPEPASALTAERLLIGTDRAPVSGWRRALYRITFGRINVGDSKEVRAQRALEQRVSVRLGGRTRYVPVLSRKGGVGKTTVTTLLGMALADLREDRIIALDANPDRGTLSDRSPGRAEFTARQLVQNRFGIASFAQLANYVTRDGSRLDVLASDSDPAVAQAFDDSDYWAVTDLLGRYYSIVLTDSGTGMVHSVMKGTLDKADSVVLVSGGSIDEAKLASETLSWLEAHGRHDLVAKAIVVINLSSGDRTQVDVGQIEEHFRSRVKTVVRIPYDRHLAEGSRVQLEKLAPGTRQAVTELAALVVDQLVS